MQSLHTTHCSPRMALKPSTSRNKCCQEHFAHIPYSVIGSVLGIYIWENNCWTTEFVFLIWLRTSRLFSITAAELYIPTVSAWKFLYSYFPTGICIFQLIITNVIVIITLLHQFSFLWLQWVWWFLHMLASQILGLLFHEVHAHLLFFFWDWCSLHVVLQEFFLQF